MSPRWLASESLRSDLRPLVSTPDGCTSGVRPTLWDEGRSGAASGRARAARAAQTPPLGERAPSGRGRPFGGWGWSVSRSSAVPCHVRKIGKDSKPLTGPVLAQLLVTKGGRGITADPGPLRSGTRLPSDDSLRANVPQQCCAEPGDRGSARPRREGVRIRNEPRFT